MPRESRKRGRLYTPHATARQAPSRETRAVSGAERIIAAASVTTTRRLTKLAALGFDDFFATPEGKMDPKEMIDRMIEIVPADTGLFRNVVPKVIEDMLKQHQLDAWNNKI